MRYKLLDKTTGQSFFFKLYIKTKYIEGLNKQKSNNERYLLQEYYSKVQISF